MGISNSIVSIIVPVYKAERWLRRCVESILGQTYADIEVLLVDDGSPDGSGAICYKYALKDMRVKVIHKMNGGVSSARNAGLKAATGEFVVFVDSDDRVRSDYCELMLRKQQEFNCDCIICGVTQDSGIIWAPSEESLYNDMFVFRNNLPVSMDLLEASAHDVKVLDNICVAQGVISLLDKEYFDFKRLHDRIHAQDAFFVTCVWLPMKTLAQGSCIVSSPTIWATKLSRLQSSIESAGTWNCSLSESNNICVYGTS